MLRNPNLVIFDTAYPENVYDIESRFVDEQSAYTNVTPYLRMYTDETKQFLVREYTNFILVNLPEDASLLTPDLYQAELIKQYGDVVVDGTKLSDFEVIE